MRKDFSARGFASPRLESDLLVCHALKLKRVELYTKFDQPLTPSELALVRTLVERRRKHEPIAYITGKREFYGRSFAVNPAVLIPRPETELVVEIVLETIVSAQPELTYRVLDLGTGSGAIAITLACERKDFAITAVDISESALQVATQNVDSHQVTDRVTLLKGSLFEPLDATRYAVIVSNPPYIPTGELAGLMPDVREHEPSLALDGGADGLTLLRHILQSGLAHIEPDGLLVLEFALGQGPALLSLAEQAGWTQVTVRKDLTGRERVLVARAPAV
jgi:release factor glutamine methyltransferase